MVITLKRLQNLALGIKIKLMKPSRHIIGFFFLILLLVFNGCDKQVELNIVGSGTTKEIPFSCGKVIINARTVHRNAVDLRQKYDLYKPAVINKDSLLIEYKGGSIPYRLYSDDGEVITDQIQITNGAEYLIGFSLNNPLPKRGDTVKIEDQGYLYCDGNRVNIGTINLIVDY